MASDGTSEESTSGASGSAAETPVTENAVTSGDVQHLLDGEGDVWIERSPDRFQVPHASPSANSYTLDTIIEWWGISDGCLVPSAVPVREPREFLGFSMRIHAYAWGLGIAAGLAAYVGSRL